MAKEKVAKPVINSLVTSLIEDLNKSFSKELGSPAAYSLDDDQLYGEVTEYVSTGLDILDIAIANTANGGLPVGRISEITGLEGSGKSLLAAYLLKSTQQKDGIAVYIDTENAISRKYMTAIGVDPSKLIYMPLSTMEDIFEAIERLIIKVRSQEKNKIMTIVVDSVMGATTKIENAADYDKDGYATQKALILSKGMRKITHMIGKNRVCLVFTNQLRQNVGAIGFGADKWVTSGGKALAFTSTVRLRLISEGKIKKKQNGIDNIVGVKTNCKVIKNRLGPPMKSVKFDIYYESGVDNYGSWLTTLKDYSIVTQNAAYYTLKLPKEMEIINEEGEIVQTDIIKFMSKDFKALMQRNQGLRDYIYGIVCEKYIMTYVSGDDYGIDDVEIDEDDD